MSLLVLTVLIFSFGSFGDLSVSHGRTKRQNIPIDEQNGIIELFYNCSCVFHYQCDREDFIITDGSNIFEVRADAQTNDENKFTRINCIGGDFEGSRVCCKHRNTTSSTISTTTTTTTGAPITTVPTTTVDTTTTTTITTQKPKPTKTCGERSDTSGRIYNTEENEKAPVDGEFPWLVAVFKENKELERWKFHASGSLIHPKVVLTANHKFESFKASDFKVIVNGRVKLSQIGENPLEERNIGEIIANPEFNSEKLTNDVTLLILDKPYDVLNTPYINTLCLRPNKSFENKRCFVAGWGKAATRSGKVAELKKVDLPTHLHSKCEELLGLALTKKDYQLHESFMCAGGERDKDACRGDGGSPLMCHFMDTSNITYPYPMYQVGIVAWGIGCGKKDIPGVYANVQFAHNWIVNRLKEKQISLD